MPDDSWKTELQEYERRMRSGFSVGNSEIVLKMGGYDYEIPWSELTTRPSVLSWVHHLCEKTWFDCDYARRFIEIVYEHQGWGDVFDDA